MQAAAAVRHQHHFRLGIVPLGHGVDADEAAAADRGQHWRLGEDLGVRPDAHLQVLRPHALLDQQRFERLGAWTAWLQALQIRADHRLHLLADGHGAPGIAAGLLLDHPFQHAGGKGHSGGLDHLQVGRRQQVQTCGVGLLATVGQQVIKAAEVAPGGIAQGLQRRLFLEQGAQRSEACRDIEDAVFAQHHGRGTGQRTGHPGTAHQGAGQAIGGKGIGRRKTKGHGQDSRVDGSTLGSQTDKLKWAYLIIR